MKDHYYSKSKQTWVPLPEMHDYHLLNAAAKMEVDADKLREIEAELVKRGYVMAKGTWSKPKEEENEAK